MTSNDFTPLFSTLHFRLILYKSIKIIHGSNRYFGGAALKELTRNFAINQFLTGGHRTVCTVPCWEGLFQQLTPSATLILVQDPNATICSIIYVTWNQAELFIPRICPLLWVIRDQTVTYFFPLRIIFRFNWLIFSLLVIYRHSESQQNRLH